MSQKKLQSVNVKLRNIFLLKVYLTSVYKMENLINIKFFYNLITARKNKKNLW